MSSSKLISLAKSDKDVHPRAVGDAFRNLTARAICLHNKESFADYFTLIQHEVSTQSDTELIAHHIGLLLEVNQDWIVLKSDVRNALKSSSRCDMLKVCRAFPDMSSHVQQMYEHSSSLFYLQRSSYYPISKVHQDDRLGPALCDNHSSYFI